MAEKYIFTPRHAKTLYTQSEREELVRILDQATKIKDIPEKVRDIVWKVINIFTWDETNEVAISCWEVTQVRNKIPRDTIKEWLYWKLNSQSFTLSLLILEREENPYIWNLKMLQSRYSSSEYTTNQARLISSIRKKSWFTKWTLRSLYRA